MAQIRFDVVTIGAGVMGCSIALELSKQGFKTAMIDRDQPGKHASYKAGGMLGAQNEFCKDSALFRLAHTSKEMFPALNQYLYGLTGIDIEYRQTGLIKMAHSLESNRTLIHQYNFLNARNRAVTTLSKDDVLNMGRQTVRPSDYFTFHIPDDGQVNANKYTHALTDAAVKHKVTRFNETEVHSIDKIDDGYKVITSKGNVFSSKVMITAGAWANQLLEGTNVTPCVTAVKGEMMLLENPEIKLDQTVFMTNGCYIIPKYNNRFLVGATSRMNDDSYGMTEKGENWLWKEAAARIPSLKNSKVLMKSSGVRPYIAGEHPVMDEIDNGLFIVGGHYRNGILLSPVIGKRMAEWVATDTCPCQIQKFSIERVKEHAMHY